VNNEHLLSIEKRFRNTTGDSVSFWTSRSFRQVFILLALPVVAFFCFLHHADAANANYSPSNLLGQNTSNGGTIYSNTSPNFGPNALGLYISSLTGAGAQNGAQNELDTVSHRLFVTDSGNNRVLVFSLDSNNAIATTTPSYVLGQSNFTSNVATSTQSVMNQPNGLAYDSANQRLFVTDSGNNRVLVFNVATSTIANGENASTTLGQANFTNHFAGVTTSTFNLPVQLAYDAANQRLFVADSSNNRVVVFNVATSTIANGENASNVLGQTAFNTNTATTTQIGMNLPEGVTYDSANQRLFVSEFKNNRVLVFNAATSTITNGEAASNILGQVNYATSTSATTQAGLNIPQGLAYDTVSYRLFVTDSGNNRVLVFNVATSTIANNETSTAVLGQASFTVSTAATTQSGMQRPQGLAYDSINQNLFVTEQSNNRVMVFSVATSTLVATGTAASNELGQYDNNGNVLYTKYAPNNGPVAQGFFQKQVFGSNPSVYGAALDGINHRLFVTDSSNNRVLVFPFNATNNITTTTPSYVLGQKDFTSSVAVATQAGFNRPQGLAYDPVNQRLFVADGQNNRVLSFNVATSTIANNESSTFVLGQTTFVASSTGNGSTGFFLSNGGGALAYDPANQRLFVGDYQNGRAMVFGVPSNATSGINGESALNILTGTTSTGQTLMGKPAGFAYDPVNQRLFIAESQNKNRVTVYNAATSTISNSEAASYVLGQPDFSTSTSNSNQAGMNTPDGVVYDASSTRLFVGDTGNSRIMVFNVATSSIANGETAQAALVTNVGQGLLSPQGIAYDGVNNRLFVPDLNNRVLLFNFITITTVSLPGGPANVPYSQTINTTSSQGTVTFQITFGSLPTGLSLATTTGVISGTPTVAGTSTFAIEADDTIGSSTFPATVNYSINISSVAPPAITSFTASSSVISNGASSTLSWTTTGATTVSLDNGIGNQSATSTGSVVVSPTSTTIYTLSANNANGTSTATTTVVVLSAPTQPQSLSVPSFTTSSVSLSWSAPSSTNGSSLTQYLVYDRFTGSSTFALYATTTPDQTTSTVTGLTTSQSYDFEILAQNAVGTSTPSNVVSSTPGDVISLAWDSTGITNLTFNGNTFEQGGSISIGNFVFQAPGGATSTYGFIGDGSTTHSSDSSSLTKIYRQGQSDSFTVKEVFATSTGNTLEIDTYIVNNDATDTILQNSVYLLPNFTFPGVITNLIPSTSITVGEYSNVPAQVFNGAWGSVAYWLGDYTKPNTFGSSYNSTSTTVLSLYSNNNSNPETLGANQYDAVAPGQTVERKVYVRFGNGSSTTAVALAPEAYATFVGQYPYLVNWPDRRPISSYFFGSNSYGTTTNPHAYFSSSYNEVSSTQAQFNAQVMAGVTSTIAALNSVTPRPQGLIIWDLEGEEFLQPFTYVGSPDKLNALSPKMDAVADQVFSTYKKAGYRVGLALRPSNFMVGTLANMPATCTTGGSTVSNLDDVYIATDVAYPNQGYVCYPQNTWVQVYARAPQFQTVVNDESVELANLVAKVNYARSRWGVKLFYIDSMVYSNGGFFSFKIMRQLQQDFPDTLFIPEAFAFNPARYSASAPYMDAPTYGQYSTPVSTRALYPNAFQVSAISNFGSSDFADPTKFSGLVTGQQEGDIMLYAGWYNSPSAIGMQQVAASSLVNYGAYTSSSYVPPSAIVNLAASSVGQTSTTLSWTAPGNNASSGTAASYDIRYSTSTITQSNWMSAAATTGDPTPQVAGTVQNYTLSALSPGTTYYAAIETYDTNGDVSDISNIASFTTLSNTVPVITSFSASSSTIVFGASSTLSWNVAGAISLAIDNGLGSQATSTGSVVVSPASTTIYTLTATNANGTSTASTTVTVSATVPTAPQSLSASSGNAQVSLSWSTPSSDGGSSLTQYLVYDRFTGSSTFALYATTTPNQATSTVTFLTNGQAYDFEILAQNSVGTSTASNVATSTPITVPTAPTNATSTPGNGFATVSVSTPASNGGSSIFLYTASSTDSNNVLATSTNRFISVPNLTNGTPYTFVVYATNLAGNSPNSSSTTVTPVNTSTVPSAPQSLTAIPSNQQIALAWSVPASDGGSSLTGYQVYDRFTGSSTFVLYATTTFSQTTSTIFSLMNGQAYDVQVLAVNAIGPSSRAFQADLVPFTVPDVPTSLSASAGNAEATISFIPGSNGGSTILFYTATSNPSNISATSTGSPVVVPGLVNEQAYTFTVTATNAAGTSASSSPSNSVTPSALAPVISSFTASPASITSGAPSTLSWTTTGADTASLDNGLGSQATSTGSVVVSPTATTIYTLTATNANGTSAAQATVSVTANNPPPPSSSGGSVGVASGYGASNYQTVTTAPPPSSPVPPPSAPSSVASLQILLNSLITQLRSLLAQAASQGISLPAGSEAYLPSGSGSASNTFTRDLQLGMTGADVTALQNFLVLENKGTAARKLATHGVTRNFAALTKAALIEFQKYVGIVPASGYFGPITRAYVKTRMQ
jgi:DNA-binding beta-propeller fold protein YncE